MIENIAYLIWPSEIEYLRFSKIGRTVGEIETLGLFSGLLEHFIECVDDIDQNSPQ